MSTDPFDNLPDEVTQLSAAARETSPVSENPALFAAMADAVATGRLASQTPTLRRRSVIGKVITAKAAAIAGVLVLTGGVAAAATGTLPDPVQNVASDAAGVVGVNIPDGNHGASVSDAAHDKSGDDDTNHGEDVSTVARDNHGHNKDDDTTSTTVAGDDNSGPGQSNGAGKSEDSHSSDNSRGKGSKGSDDSADHDANDDHGDDDVTATTVANTPTTARQSDDSSDHDANDDSSAGRDSSGRGGSSNSGRGSDD